MRLAIISDIHGNLPALEAVLEDAARQGAERIVVNGDMVNRGPSNVAVMERLQREGLPMTLGNHDDLLRKWAERDADLPAEWFDDPFWRGTGWCAEQLEPGGWLGFFRELPMTVGLELPNAPRLLISHGSPRHYREGYGNFLTDEALEEISRDHPAELFVGSHTHRPLERAWGDVTVLNTGAVGAPFNGDPRAQYLVLELQGDGWRWEFRRLPYDRDRALDDFATSGYLEEGGLSARIFFEELRNARSYLTPFLGWTAKHGLAQDESSWRDFQRAFPERFQEVDPLAS